MNTVSLPTNDLVGAATTFAGPIMVIRVQARSIHSALLFTSGLST
jgi:hypothetical protein